jgi:hypothetical protein
MMKKKQSTTRKPEKTFEEMLNAIGDSLSNLVSSNDEEDGEHKEDKEDTELGKLSEDDEPGWVMGTISKTVQYHKEGLRQKQMRLDKLIKQEWGDPADYCRERDMKYRMTKLMVLAVRKPQTHSNAATPVLTTFGKLLQTVHIVAGQSQMPQGTSQPASSQMRLGSENPQSHTDMTSLQPDAVANVSPIENAKPVEPISFKPCISHP